MSDREVTRALFALCVLFLMAFLFGAWTGFPVYNDAYLVGFIREFGAGSIAADHPDRPLYGFLLQWLARAFGLNRAPYVVIGIGSWILLAWQTARLWRRVFPAEQGLWPLCSMLVVSPILVEAQYTTVTEIIPVNLPVSLCLTALLICLADPEARPATLVIPAGLVLLAAAVSEYGLATMVASAAFLLVVRHRRPAVALLVGGAAGYVIFRIISDEEASPFTNPSILLPALLRQLPSSMGRWMTGWWHSLLGAWLSAISEVRLDYASRSSWVAIAGGLVSAMAMARVLRGVRSPAEAKESGRRVVALGAAVAAGLLPVTLALRPLVAGSIYSRVLTPVLSFAAIAFVALTSRLVAIRARVAVFAFLAFLAGYHVTDEAFETRRRQQFLESVGARLLPLVTASKGITVAVLPGQVERTDLTPKVNFRWGDELAKRVWVLLPDEAESLFGPRVACHHTDLIATPPELHSTGRYGPVSHLVWLPVSSRTDKWVGVLEPYCVEPVLR